MTLKLKVTGHKTIAFVALPIYTHIPNLKGLTKIFFKLSCPKGNLCGSGNVTVLNPKFPRLLSGDTISAKEQALCQLTLCFELQSTSESKNKDVSERKRLLRSYSINYRSAALLCVKQLTQK